MSSKIYVDAEDSKTVAYKGQVATKILADIIGMKFQQYKFNSQSTIDTETRSLKENDQKVNIIFKNLIEAIIQKFHFVNQMKEVDTKKPQVIGNIKRYLAGNTVTEGKSTMYEYKGEEKRNVNVTENPRSVSPMRSQIIDSGNSAHDTVSSEIRKKKVQIVIERPVYKEIIKEVPYNEYRERQVVNEVEREIIIEEIIEKPTERVTEKAIERKSYVNVEYEVIEEEEFPVYVDVDVPNYVYKDVIVEVAEDVYVDRPVEVNKIVNVVQPVRNEIQIKEVIREVNQVENVFVDKEVIEKRVVVHEVDDPIEQIRKNRVVVEKPVYIDRVIENKVERVVNVVVDVPEIKQVKKSIKVDRHVENIINVVKEIPKIVIEEVPRIEEVHTVRKINTPRSVQRIVEVPKYVTTEVVQEHIVEQEVHIDVPREVVREVENIIEVPIYQEKMVEVPVEKRVAKYIEKPIRIDKEIEVEKIVEVEVEKFIDKPVYQKKIIKKTVEREIINEIPVIEKVPRKIKVERIVEKPIYVDKIVEVPVEREVKIFVEVPFDKVVERTVEEEIEVPHKVVTYVDKPIYVEKKIEELSSVYYEGKNKALRSLKIENIKTLESLRSEVSRLEQEYMMLMNELGISKSHSLQEEICYGFEENVILRQTLNELHNTYNIEVESLNSKQIQSMIQDHYRKSSDNSRFVSQRSAQSTEFRYVNRGSGIKDSFSTVHPISRTDSTNH